jgi:hypothetical protein
MVGETTSRRQPVDGDIVVTKVADHYQTARVQAEGRPWASVQATDRLADALTLACGLVSGSQRVFLYTHDGLFHRIAIDCTRVH